MSVTQSSGGSNGVFEGLKVYQYEESLPKFRKVSDLREKVRKPSYIMPILSNDMGVDVCRFLLEKSEPNKVLAELYNDRKLSLMSAQVKLRKNFNQQAAAVKTAVLLDDNFLSKINRQVRFLISYPITTKFNLLSWSKIMFNNC